ncbi:MAG: BF3164 family lipoprotein [Candidatus Aminicenantes bacterium]|nr:BF3164 family lipoprotein [Candidatus Aminicenantes bacterium]
MKKILPLLLFLAITSLSAQQIIDNGKTPQNKNAGRVLKLNEALRIDGEGDDYFYDGVNTLQLDSSGNIYINDVWSSNQNGHLVKFSPEGQFLNDLYRKGEGPGEIQSGYDFFFSDKKVYVFDYMKRKLIVMEEDGTFVREFKIASDSSYDFVGIFEDWLVFTRRDTPFERKTSRLYDVNNVIVFVSKDGQTKKDFYTFSNQQFFISGAQGGGNMDWDPFISIIEDGKLYVYSTQEYLVEILDLKTGQITSRFRRSYSRKKHEIQDWEKMFSSKFSAPKRKFESDIKELFYDGSLLWIQTSTETEDKGQMFDVFDSNGRFLDSFFVNTKGTIKKIDGDYLYSSETNEDDLPFLMKYKIVK